MMRGRQDGPGGDGDRCTLDKLKELEYNEKGATGASGEGRAF